jgi:hypothetical protein
VATPTFAQDPEYIHRSQGGNQDETVEEQVPELETPAQPWRLHGLSELNTGHEGLPISR